MKQFTSIDNQIKILENRNLKFTDKAKAKQYLLHNNYYNIVNCYSKFFFEAENHYIDKTTFDNIIEVHHFDKEIKACFFKFIIESEKHFKSLFAHRYCENFCNIPYAYFDIKNYNNRDLPQIANFISQLSKIILSKKSANTKNSILHYEEHHKDVPLWILVNYMTYGQISTFFSYMPDKLKNIVAKDLSFFIEENYGMTKAILTPAELESFLYNIVEIRNIIAHDNKLLNYTCKKSTKYNKYLNAKYGIKKEEPRQDVFNMYIVLSCFLSKNQYLELTNTIKKRIKKLKKKVSVESSKKIISALGFPIDFELSLK